MQIQCTNCGKTIEKKGVRTLCIKCRNLIDKIHIAQKTQTEEYRQFKKEKYLAKKGSLI